MKDGRMTSQQHADDEQARKPRVGGDPAVVRVGDASTGAVYAIALASNHVVIEELREELARISGIPAHDQILLGGPPFARLDPRRPVEFYGLPTVLPSQPVASSEGSRMLSESSHPMMRALVEYEGYFQLQVSQSEALEKGTRANITASERGTRELQVQERAIAAAVANLDLFKTSMMKHFAPFWADFQAASDKHVRLLSQFDSYLATLATVELHPALTTDTRKTLFDCIPVDKEREWAVQCEQSQSHVHAQVMRLLQVHDKVGQEVTDMVTAHEHASREYEEASAELQQMKALASKQAGITATLRDNLVYVLSSIEETSSIASGSNPMQASTNALDVCRRIDELYQGQQDMLPEAQKLVEDIVELVRKIAASKSALFARVHSTLRQISISQSKIRDFESSLAVFREALTAQKKHFYELEHLDKLPGTVQHREEFLRSYGQHLPRDFVSGLAEKPSHCEFRMRPFDQSLPLIEDETIDNEEFDAFEEKERSPSDEFAHGEEPESTRNVELLRERCNELEERVSELTAELEQSKKNLYYDGSGSDSISRSDVSKTSAREGDSSCEFPLVLALAATAGAMTSSSEADRSNLLDRDLARVKPADGTGGLGSCEMLVNVVLNRLCLYLSDVGSGGDGKDAAIAKLEVGCCSSFSSVVLFVAFTEIQERSKREKQLQENQVKLQQAIKTLRNSAGAQRTSLAKLLQLLQLPVEPMAGESEDANEFVTSNLDVVETRVKELLASAESEKVMWLLVLPSELERRQTELSLMESDHDVSDSFKISFRSFSVSDLALFLPTSAPGSDSQRVYLAFHLGCPHRFLSEESISSFSNDGQRYPDYVVGRIVMIDPQTAEEGNNPYALLPGTTFYILTVASLHES
ncbi:hypothetical protein BBJ28_00016740 [Nothophytophthora sp. Chile5]|nr:hypothetical protein BBJ28_00016740 [Nothophytophthora sp. Chile5]